MYGTGEDLYWPQKKDKLLIMPPKALVECLAEHRKQDKDRRKKTAVGVRLRQGKTEGFKFFLKNPTIFLKILV